MPLVSKFGAPRGVGKDFFQDRIIRRRARCIGIIQSKEDIIERYDAGLINETERDWMLAKLAEMNKE